MSSPLKALDIPSFLKEAVSSGEFPGGVVLIADGPASYRMWAYGERVSSPRSLPVVEDTIFDLASLTKPLITSLLFVLLMRRGFFSLDETISRFLPQFGGGEKGKITLQQLLTHTGGFAPWLPLYLLAPSREEAVSVIRSHPLSSPPGEKVIYSCLGYILLGFIIEKASGSSLSQLASELIFHPLSLKRTFFPPPRVIKEEIAATEIGRTYEREKSSKFLSDDSVFPFPNELVWGEVHDGNARFLGGVAGNAGLFSTAYEVFLIAREFLGWGKLLSPWERDLFFTDLTPELNEARSLGFRLTRGEDDLPFSILSPLSAYHTGFTGTSLFIDQSNRFIVVFLTNRIHPRVPERSFEQMRRKLLRLARDYLAH